MSSIQDSFSTRYAEARQKFFTAAQGAGLSVAPLMPAAYWSSAVPAMV